MLCNCLTLNSALVKQRNKRFLGSIGNAISGLFGGGGGNSNQNNNEVDPCSTYTCFNRVNNNGTVTDYPYDKPYGCISKGLNRKDVNIFDDCCDEHNKCLNAQCCTNNCQELKESCDFKYSGCLATKCVKVSQIGSNANCIDLMYVLFNANNQKCIKNELSTNRKICLC